MKTYELHPLCTLFPRVQGDAFDALVADIKANGLREPITLHDGMILDGGNRYAACIAAEIEPKFVQFAGASIGAFVLSANLHRRHLSPGQQAAIVASVQDWTKAQSVGRPKSAHVSTLPDTTQTRSEQSGASVSTQRRADAVAKADPELARKVAHGDVSLSKAVAQVAPSLAPRRTKPKPEPTQETSTADEAFGDTNLVDLLEEMRVDNENLQEQVNALSADDQAAETLKWRRMYEHAMRRQSEIMEEAKGYDRDRRRTGNQVKECCKILRLDDPRNLVSAVRRLVARVEAA